MSRIQPAASARLPSAALLFKRGTGSVCFPRDRGRSRVGQPEPEWQKKARAAATSKTARAAPGPWRNRRRDYWTVSKSTATNFGMLRENFTLPTISTGVSRLSRLRQSGSARRGRSGAFRRGSINRTIARRPLHQRKRSASGVFGSYSAGLPFRNLPARARIPPERRTEVLP